MKKASIIMAVLACAIIAAAYTNSVPISTSTRAATEKWTAIRFEPALPPTPENAASKFLAGNREWQTVTAAQIGALTNELDLAALRTYHYGSLDIVESPAEWFVFDGAGTITGFNWAAGRENVVIPWAIGGVPVTAIGNNAFELIGIVSLIAPQTITSVGSYAFDVCISLASVSLPQVQTVGDYAFADCGSLASVSLPQVQTVGNTAFNYCSSLSSVSLPQAQMVGGYAFGSCISLASVYFDNDAPTIGYDIFAGITPNQVTNYVTNPQATGWGATLGGMPVVRLPLYADAIYQAGELVATTGYVAQASLADADGYTTQIVMRVGSEIATNRWPTRLTLPDGIVTNGMGGMTATTNSAGVPYVRFSGKGGAWGNAVTMGGSLYFDDWGARIIFGDGSGLNMSSMYFAAGTGGFSYWNGAAQAYSLRVDFGNVSVPDGNLTVSGTNTAAEVRSLGGYSIFDSGSNCYWRVTASNGTFYASDTNGVRKFKFTTETP